MLIWHLDEESKEEESTSDDKTDHKSDKVDDKDEEKKEVEGEGEKEEVNLTREMLIQNFKDGKYKYVMSPLSYKFSIFAYSNSGRNLMFCRKISVLTGAGISVSAGIPDFRSPKIGLYATLKEKYGMDDPTEIFSLDSFLEKPEIFYDFSKEFDWTKYSPTLTHYFISFLNKKGILDINFTQNIDCLEIKSGLPEDKLIAAHGNLSGAHCIKCKGTESMEVFREHARQGKILYCQKCKNIPIKPSVVFFGENLPKKFFDSMPKINEADLGIIVGTSLVVSPFSSLPELFK